MERRGVYFASKVVHAPLWIAEEANGVTVTSSWIHEAGEGQTADYAELSTRCSREISGSERLILYGEPGEILKGALIEAGMALQAGVPVFQVGEPGNLSRVFRRHPLWVVCTAVGDALRAPLPDPHRS